jgi:hypothetical protein
LYAFRFEHLPELFNVLKGEMTLFGDRPHPPERFLSEGTVWLAPLGMKPAIIQLNELRSEFSPPSEAFDLWRDVYASLRLGERTEIGGELVIVQGELQREGLSHGFSCAFVIYGMSETGAFRVSNLFGSALSHVSILFSEKQHAPGLLAAAYTAWQSHVDESDATPNLHGQFPLTRALREIERTPDPG